ncbi:hypothetical protein [Actinoplanes utahensis]|uniref:Abi-like protein n=1 Tax=Actinoplanes utahensis TaxID=1869 RepID=A0A0A6UMW5_ACTUT|nr:hypothetical protein [Actinoplanes utahensis]KHD76398.1 hypothetical protein MB27_16945 [Actinoplanes utahensis]GIF29825.1 hypothetical protein Aut01nite_28110 [Actinoplanes utahensis]
MRADQLIDLEHGLSPERLAPYRRACHDDLAAAIELYRWNTELSAALSATLGHVEVRLRNALHQELTSWSALRHGEPRWFLDPGGTFFPPELHDIAKARRRATRDGRPETPGQVIAELNLGFWKYLLARRYDRGLWHPCLHRAFPRQPRSPVFAAVDQVHLTRNRIAHHEPMFDRPALALRDTALRVVEWICPVTREWIEADCRVPEVLAARPH